MDLVYMPEVLTYGSLRMPMYRDYEQPWNKNYFNYGKSSSIYCPRQQQLPRTQSRDNCQLCKESKRRSLAAYIRGKSRLNSCSEVHEEEDESANTNESAEKKKLIGADCKDQK